MVVVIGCCYHQLNNSLILFFCQLFFFSIFLVLIVLCICHLVCILLLFLYAASQPNLWKYLFTSQYIYIILIVYCSCCCWFFFCLDGVFSVNIYLYVFFYSFHNGPQLFLNCFRQSEVKHCHQPGSLL